MLTRRQQEILEFLRDNPESGPTMIGLRVFRGTTSKPSTIVARKLKFLLQQGLVIRDEQGRYSLSGKGERRC